MQFLSNHERIKNDHLIALPPTQPPFNEVIFDEGDKFLRKVGTLEKMHHFNFKHLWKKIDAYERALNDDSTPAHPEHAKSAINNYINAVYKRIEKKKVGRCIGT